MDIKSCSSAFANLGKSLKNLSNKLKVQDKKLKDQDKKIEEQNEKIEEQDKKLTGFDAIKKLAAFLAPIISFLGKVVELGAKGIA